jgi:hypothetical protein
VEARGRVKAEGQRIKTAGQTDPVVIMQTANGVVKGRSGVQLTPVALQGGVYICMPQVNIRPGTVTSFSLKYSSNCTGEKIVLV